MPNQIDKPTDGNPIGALLLAVNSHAEVLNGHGDVLKKQAALIDLLMMATQELLESVRPDLVERFVASVRELIRSEIEAAVEANLAEREVT